MPPLFQRPHVFCCAIKDGRCLVVTLGLGRAACNPSFPQEATLHPYLKHAPPTGREFQAGFMRSYRVWGLGPPHGAPNLAFAS